MRFENDNPTRATDTNADRRFRAMVWRCILVGIVIFYTTCGYLAIHGRL